MSGGGLRYFPRCSHLLSLGGRRFPRPLFRRIDLPIWNVGPCPLLVSDYPATGLQHAAVSRDVGSCCGRWTKDIRNGSLRCPRLFLPPCPRGVDGVFLGYCSGGRSAPPMHALPLSPPLLEGWAISYRSWHLDDRHRSHVGRRSLDKPKIWRSTALELSGGRIPTR